MQVSDEFDFDKADALSVLIMKTINHDSDLTHREVLTALSMSVGDIIASIECSDCRESAAKAVTKDLVPRAVAAAMSGTATISGQRH